MAKLKRIPQDWFCTSSSAPILLLTQPRPPCDRIELLSEVRDTWLCRLIRRIAPWPLLPSMRRYSWWSSFPYGIRIKASRPAHNAGLRCVYRISGVITPGYFHACRQTTRHSFEFTAGQSPFLCRYLLRLRSFVLVNSTITILHFEAY